jgi:hypothetical protein
MGPLETQLRARRLAARQRLWAANPEPQGPAQARNVTVENCALRREITALRALLRANGILEKPEWSAPFDLRCSLVRAAVCKFYKVRLSELDAKRRIWAAVRPRHVAMYLCRTLTRRSMQEIGRRFGGRHHSTVLHAARKIELLRENDRKLDDELRELKRRIVDKVAEAAAEQDSPPEQEGNP